jgi:hypothetical protein
MHEAAGEAARGKIRKRVFDEKACVAYGGARRGGGVFCFLLDLHANHRQPPA